MSRQTREYKQTTGHQTTTREIKFDQSLEICANCIYFDKFKMQKREDNLLGACKANPPFPASMQTKIESDNEEEKDDKFPSKLGVWPLVLGTFFCGVFRSKFEDREE